MMNCLTCLDFRYWICMIALSLSPCERVVFQSLWLCSVESTIQSATYVYAWHSLFVIWTAVLLRTIVTEVNLSLSLCVHQYSSDVLQKWFALDKQSYTSTNCEAIMFKDNSSHEDSRCTMAHPHTLTAVLDLKCTHCACSKVWHPVAHCKSARPWQVKQCHMSISSCM